MLNNKYIVISIIILIIISIYFIINNYLKNNNYLKKTETEDLVKTIVSKEPLFSIPLSSTSQIENSNIKDVSNTTQNTSTKNKFNNVKIESIPTSNTNELNKLKYKLILELKKTNKILNDLIPTNSSSLFTNIEKFSNTSLESIILNPQTFSEINKYSDTYNKNIALLDDPNKLKEASFNTYMYLQNKKIEGLRKELKILQDNMAKHNEKETDIKAFKSMNNSQILNVEIYKSPENNNNINSNSNYSNYSNNTNNTTYPNYLIYGNGGCLQYESNNNSTTTPPSWSFKPCNSNEPKQQFISNKINSLKNYNSYIKDSKYQINDDKNIMFGFNIIQPITQTPDTPIDQCLQLNNDGLSIMPCTLDYSQRFKPSYITILP
jgi:hypothetical protein